MLIARRKRRSAEIDELKMNKPKHRAQTLRLLFAAGILIFPLLAADADACQCRERQPPCAEYSSADAVFVGSVTEIKLTADMVTKIISFAVERGLVGVNSRVAQLVDYGTSCDYTFEVGKKYLVYAYPKQEEFG